MRPSSIGNGQYANACGAICNGQEARGVFEESSIREKLNNVRLLNRNCGVGSRKKRRIQRTTVSTSSNPRILDSSNPRIFYFRLRKTFASPLRPLRFASSNPRFLASSNPRILKYSNQKLRSPNTFSYLCRPIKQYDYGQWGAVRCWLPAFFVVTKIMLPLDVFKSANYPR
jgi:hypothetical protein